MGSRLDRVTNWDEPARKAGYGASSLATCLGVTPRHLRRYFVRLRGMTPEDFLNRLRLDDACAALILGVEVKRVAAMAGFQHGAHFSRWFKRTTGICPNCYAAFCASDRLSPPKMSSKGSKCPLKVSDLSFPPEILAQPLLISN